MTKMSLAIAIPMAMTATMAPVMMASPPPMNSLVIVALIMICLFQCDRGGNRSDLEADASEVGPTRRRMG